MNARQFFDLTAKVRHAQKDYFAARKAGLPMDDCNALLAVSRGLESRLDAEITRVQKLTAEPELNFKQ